MTTQHAEPKFRCNSCLRKFHTSKELKFKHGQVLLSQEKEKCSFGRIILQFLSVRAWRYICKGCEAAELNQNKMHISMNNGRIIELSSDEWVSFCNEYQDIALHYNFGKGLDKFGQHSAWKVAADTPTWFKYGGYKTYSVLSFFAPKASEHKHNVISDDVPPTYDTSGVRFNECEFEAMIDFFILKNFAQIMKKGDWIKEQKMPEHMHANNLPYRNPNSYDALFGRVEKSAQQGKVHKLLKNKRISKKYEKLIKQIEDAKKEKYNMGTTKDTSISAAKNGLFAKDHREDKKNEKKKETENENDLITNGLKNHSKKFHDKKYFQEQNLECSKKQTAILGTIGHNLSLMGMTSDDYFGDLVVYVTMEYLPESERKKVVNIIEKHKNQFSVIWGVVVRQGTIKWTNTAKNKLIAKTMKQITKTDE